MRRILSPSYLHGKNTKKTQKMKELFLVLILLSFIFGLIVIAFMSNSLKKLTNSIPSNVQISAKVEENGENSYLYDRNGELLYVFKDPNRDREYVKYEEIPSNIRWALVVAEDEDFYIHEGLDYEAIFRGIAILIESKGENKVGGSTITQQLVKNTVLTNEKTFDRKVKEMIIASYVETKYSKEQILELYLNSAPFGGRITGIKAATRTYFNKDLQDLSLEEAVFLISLIQTPGESSPLFSSNEQYAWDLVEYRSNYIFEQLKKNLESIKEREETFYSFEQIEDSERINVALDPNLGEINAPHFTFYIKNLLESDPYNISEEELYNGGYKIYSSLDLGLQKLAESDLIKGVERYKGYGMNNAALISINPEEGDLLAMVGSLDYWGERDVDGKFDPHVNVTLSPRNLGSSLKPFLAYEGFRQKKYSPYSIVPDKPIDIRGYSPKNSDGTFLGNITIRQSLIDSRNTPFVQILDNVGVQNFLKLLNLLDYDNATLKDTYGLSIALGGFESNLLEHTHAYAALANDGNLVDLRPILSIKNNEDNEIFKAPIINNIVLDSNNVKQVNSILSAYGPKGVYGKTGTTDSNKDTYFMGFNDKLATGLWTGNNNNARMRSNSYGSTTALPIWKIYHYDIIKNRPDVYGIDVDSE